MSRTSIACAAILLMTVACRTYDRGPGRGAFEPQRDLRKTYQERQTENEQFYQQALPELEAALADDDLEAEEELTLRSRFIRALLELGRDDEADREIKEAAKRFARFDFIRTTADPGVLHLIAAQRALIEYAMESDDRKRLLWMNRSVAETLLAESRVHPGKARRFINIRKVLFLRKLATAYLSSKSPEHVARARRALEMALEICRRYYDRPFTLDQNRIQTLLNLLDQEEQSAKSRYK